MRSLFRGIGYLSLITVILSGITAALEKGKVIDYLGTETGWRTEPSPAGTLAISLWRERQCKVRLQLVGGGNKRPERDDLAIGFAAGTLLPAAGAAAVGPAQKLNFTTEKIGTKEWLVLDQLLVTDKDKKEGNRVNLTWPGGVFLLVGWADKAKTDPIELHNWELYVTDGNYDSQGLACWRWGIVGILAGSALLTPLIALKKENAQPSSTLRRVDQSDLEGLINKVGSGANAAVQQQLLRRWIMNRDPDPGAEYHASRPKSQPEAGTFLGGALSDSSAARGFRPPKGLPVAAGKQTLTSHRGLSWHALLARMAAQPRDEEAWTEAAGRLQHLACHVAPPSIRSDPDLPADLADRVLMKLHGQPELLCRLGQEQQEMGPPQRYLIKMLHNAAIDAARHRQRATEGQVPLIDIPSSESSPGLSVERAEWVAAVRACVSEEEWSLLRQRYWEGRSIVEIAQGLRLPYHTVAMRLFRLHKLLRSQVMNL